MPKNSLTGNKSVLKKTSENFQVLERQANYSAALGSELQVLIAYEKINYRISKIGIHVARVERFHNRRKVLQQRTRSPIVQ
jgi:hypothetical protein